MPITSLRILSFLITLLLSACGDDKKLPTAVTPANPPSASATEPDTAIGFTGTDRTRFRSVESNTSEYSYPQYTVRVVPNAENVGEKVSVTATASNRSFEIAMPEDGYFSGLHGHFLFLDAGTGPGERGLTIVDLRTNQPVLETTYYEVDRVDSAGNVTFWFPVETEKVQKLPACPDQAEWVRNGLSVGYGQRRVYNLNTGKTAESQEYKCVPLQ
jgi:hypothetical protein